MQFTIEAPGLPSELHPRAEEEIRMLAGILAEVASQRNKPFLLKRVLLTTHFEEDVNRILQERSGFTGYIAARSNGRAIAKTLWTHSQQEGIGFVIIIDANLIGPWGLTNARCLTTILHELAHVLYEACHLERLGEEEYTAVGDTRERLLDRWASRLLDEFDVDRLVDVIVGTIATKDDGQAWSLCELEEAQSANWTQALLEGLRQMPQIIDERVWQFRAWQLRIEDLAGEVLPYVNDLLILLSHTAAIYLGTEQWPDILIRIKGTTAVQRFFGEHLDAILEQFEDAPGSLEESVEAVSNAIEGIFRNCGLSFETISEGVYIGVNDPAR